jgi:hypothetical protein
VAIVRKSRRLVSCVFMDVLLCQNPGLRNSRK